MRRRAAFLAALPFALLPLAACSRDAPAPPSLPAFADQGDERDCNCVEHGDCAVPDAAAADAFEGQSETRGFQCRWDDRAAGRATCTYESRFRLDAPNAQWVPWARSTVRLRHLGERGWCWTERSSDRVL